MSPSESPQANSLHPSRRGFSSVEALASLALMAVILAFVGQWSSTMLRHRQGIARRRAAIQATDNVVALAMAADYSQLTTEHLLAVAKPYTPEGGLWDIRVEPAPLSDRAGVLQKRIVVGLKFAHRLHYDVQPLVVWKFAQPEEVMGHD